jgi:hypothetical protein
MNSELNLSVRVALTSRLSGFLEGMGIKTFVSRCFYSDAERQESKKAKLFTQHEIRQGESVHDFSFAEVLALHRNLRLRDASPAR